MAGVTVESVPCLSDNYAWIIHDPASEMTAVVDPSEAAPINKYLSERNLRLTHIINTHHHRDHTGGNEELKAQHGATVIGPKADADRIPCIDVQLSGGDVFALSPAAAMHCLDTPGHTRGHASYYLPLQETVFTGDTLFSLGCGRLFEGTASQMVASLAKIAALPPQTRVCCGHEYTAANARFALSVDPDNAELQRVSRAVSRARGATPPRPTVPSLLADELAANPFLRAHAPELRRVVAKKDDALVEEVFAALRAAKDGFKG
ncbi:hypothetical protein H632_c330p0 [Helicosporidium sp. ATCC 50920]|nr:hypothetical protein H632_c330p0 [Helicosporidium sp. ATCC 50920]|eukprot:KDD76166.1 hypothetical protein H632_c330p0 [Helicosporidium sp. ATCC 50920]